MRKSDVLRLKMNDVILYAYDAHACGEVTMGTVREISPRGGIRARNVRSGRLEWVPYHHAIRRVRRAGEPVSEDERWLSRGLCLQ
jgi:hypothetical protein